MSSLPDLDNRENIRRFVEAFYERLLQDEVLAPIFVDVAEIDIRDHFPRICAYWEKLLLGEQDYQRHTMNIHRQLDHQRTLTAADFDRWLDYFESTVHANFAGPKAYRACMVARRIAENMHKTLRRERS